MEKLNKQVFSGHTVAAGGRDLFLHGPVAKWPHAACAQQRAPQGPKDGTKSIYLAGLDFLANSPSLGVNRSMCMLLAGLSQEDRNSWPIQTNRKLKSSSWLTAMSCSEFRTFDNVGDGTTQGSQEGPRSKEGHGLCAFAPPGNDPHAMWLPAIASLLVCILGRPRIDMFTYGTTHDSCWQGRSWHTDLIKMIEHGTSCATVSPSSVWVCEGRGLAESLRAKRFDMRNPLKELFSNKGARQSPTQDFRTGVVGRLWLLRWHTGNDCLHSGSIWC